MYTQCCNVYTKFAEVLKRFLGRAMVDHVTQREEGKAVKQLEDSVSRLMNGHDDNPTIRHSQAA